MSSIRVLVVDPDPGLARSLTTALPRRGVSVMGPVVDEVAAIEALNEGVADLVLVDLDRTDGRGYEVIAAIAGAGNMGRVLAASAQGGADAAASALSAGACGMLPAERDASLVDVFRRALAGELVLPADDLSRLVDRLTGPKDAARRDADVIGALTAREREILRTLAAGASTAEVAEAFGISPLTVQSHVKNILAKLRVHSKVEAVRIAWRHGLATIVPASTGNG
ncbi:MAG TPA: response regulator transcription factor [Actinomycetota bacterium]|jgi:DNA-binding NarL/FixJ family response regulator|nr:response regulator transcription factor [Actinomycetota bacterium]